MKRDSSHEKFSITFTTASKCHNAIKAFDYFLNNGNESFYSGRCHAS